VTKSREPLVVLQRLGNVHNNDTEIEIMNARHFYRQPEPRLSAPLALRPRDAAASLGVSTKTLERITKAGEIASVLVGRVRLYEVEQLQQYLASHRVAGQEVTR
jgi:excisionase family DNA binding protein